MATAINIWEHWRTHDGTRQGGSLVRSVLFGSSGRVPPALRPTMASPKRNFDYRGLRWPALSGVKPRNRPMSLRWRGAWKNRRTQRIRNLWFAARSSAHAALTVFLIIINVFIRLLIWIIDYCIHFVLNLIYFVYGIGSGPLPWERIPFALVVAVFSLLPYSSVHDKPPIWPVPIPHGNGRLYPRMMLQVSQNVNSLKFMPVESISPRRIDIVRERISILSRSFFSSAGFWLARWRYLKELCGQLIDDSNAMHSSLVDRLYLIGIDDVFKGYVDAASAAMMAA